MNYKLYLTLQHRLCMVVTHVAHTDSTQHILDMAARIDTYVGVILYFGVSNTTPTRHGTDKAEYLIALHCHPR